MRTRSILGLLLVAVVWGTTFVPTRLVLTEVPPFLLAALRFVLAVGILLPLAWREPLPRPVPWGGLVAAGLCGVTLFYLGFNVGLLYTSGADAALIQGAIPAITAVLAALFLGERPGGRRVGGIALSLAGVGLIVLLGGERGGASNPLLGNALIGLAAVAWSAYTLLVKRLKKAPQLGVTAWSSLFGLVGLLPLAGLELALGGWPAISPESWLAVIYLGVIASALAYLLWNRALEHLSATTVASFLNLIPVVGVAAAVALLRESVAPGQLLGGALVLVGVWLTTR